MKEYHNYVLLKKTTVTLEVLHNKKKSTWKILVIIN